MIATTRSTTPHLRHVWRVRKWRPDRFGEPCQVLARGKGPGPLNVLVQFCDGERVVGARYSVRRLEGRKPSPAPSVVRSPGDDDDRLPDEGWDEYCLRTGRKGRVS